MNKKVFLPVVASILLGACASTPQAGRWEAATEAEVAAALDGPVLEAAKELVKLKKDGKLMFCKRFKEVGSNIPTITCITEAQLRERVQNMGNYRDEMRNRSGRCTTGVGCAENGVSSRESRW
jgi:hypothetical protein